MSIFKEVAPPRLKEPYRLAATTTALAIVSSALALSIIGLLSIATAVPSHSIKLYKEYRLPNLNGSHMESRPIGIEDIDYLIYSVHLK